MGFKDKYRTKDEEDPTGLKKEVSNDAYLNAEMIETLISMINFIGHK